MTRLKTNALRTISAAMLISVLTAVTGCSDRKPDIDYDLIGGTYEAGENEYKVQIFSDSSDTTVKAPTESEAEATTSSAPETTKSTTTKPAVTREVRPGAKDIIIVPALCCDRYGNRLGHGAGYYDRYLAHSEAFSVCLCRKALIEEKLPTEDTDIAVSLVLSD